MKYCSKCKVTVDAPRKYCPLCKGVLTGGDGTERKVFPLISTMYRKHNLFFRILIFISVCIATAVVSVNFMMPETGFWSLMVLLGEGGFWLAVATAIRRRTSISKRIIWQMVVLSFILIVIDRFSGWQQWSINYVVPLVLLFTILGIAIIEIFVLAHQVEEYVAYLLVSCAFGLVPLVFVLAGWAKVRWPSILCVAGSVITIAALVLFAGRGTRRELEKRLHL